MKVKPALVNPQDLKVVREEKPDRPVGTLSELLRIQKRPLDIVFSNHPWSNNGHQGKITLYVNWLQNTIFFFKKYQVDLI
jgi:hypothetical protein